MNETVEKPSGSIGAVAENLWMMEMEHACVFNPVATGHVQLLRASMSLIQTT